MNRQVHASSRRSQPGAWPTEQQELLIEAALLNRDRAEVSWRAWSAEASIDDVEWASFHLLPQVYANLRPLEVQTADMERLKGTYRYTWYKGNRVARECSEVLRRLQSAAGAVLVVQDLALAAHYYADYGRRPISAVSLAVPTDRAIEALDALDGLGVEFPTGSKERLTRVRSSIPIGRAGGPPTTLHWRTTPRDPSYHSCWDAAVPTEIGGVEVLVPSPADLLHDVCGYGVRWDTIAPTIWIVDALTVLQQPVDWDRLLLCAATLHTTLAVRSALAYLKRRFEAPVPVTILRRMEATAISRGERVAWEARTGQPRLWRKAQAYWYAYGELAGGGWEKIGGFPIYLQQSWELEHLWQVLPLAGRLVTKQLASAMREKPQR